MKGGKFREKKEALMRNLRQSTVNRVIQAKNARTYEVTSHPQADTELLHHSYSWVWLKFYFLSLMYLN